MPLLIVEGPILKDKDKKRDLIIALTEAASKTYKLPREAITVLIKENSPENVGIGGQLLAERIPRCR